MQKSQKQKQEEDDEGPHPTPATGPGSPGLQNVEHTSNTEPACSESKVSRLTSWFQRRLTRQMVLGKCSYQI
jgi:hypothetical protein